MLFGVVRAERGSGEQALLVEMTIVPFDNAVAKRVATLHAELISQNQDIGIKDVFIAATCLEQAMPILTANKKHFSRVTGLEVITPVEIVAKD